MPYIKRDNKKNIESIYNTAQSDHDEFLPNNNAEVLAFLTGEEQFSARHESVEQDFLNQTDSELIRVLEDLVDLLTGKHVILFTDLPTAAQNKLLQRKSMRKNLQHSILDDEEDNIF